MPVAGLESLLNQRNLLQEMPLSELQNAVIGVDVDHFLSRVLNPSTNLNYEAIGGIPLSLENRLDEQLELLKPFDIKLVFVFPGLRSQYTLEAQRNILLLPNEQLLKKAWDSSSNNPVAFRSNDFSLKSRPLMSYFIELLIKRNIEYQIAPFFAQHQLLYLLKENIIHTVMTSNDFLLFNDPKKIIYDFKPEKFVFIDISYVLSSLNIQKKQFKDISMIVSNIFQPQKLNNNEFSSVLNKAQSLNSFVTSEISKTQFLKGLTILEFAPALKLNGRVEPIPMNFQKSFLEGPLLEPKIDSIPGDIFSVLGGKLPDELFFYQSIGLSCLDTTESITSLTERMPSDLLMSDLYKNLIISPMSIKIKGDLIHLLTLKFNRAFQRSEIELQAYLNANLKPIKKSVNRAPLDYFNFSHSLILQKNFGNSFILEDFILSLTDEFLKENQRSKPVALLSTEYELVGTALLRALVTYELIENEVISPWLLCLTKFISENKLDNETALFLTIFFKRVPELTKSLICEPNLTPIVNSDNLIDKLTMDQLTLISKFSTLYTSTHFKPDADNYNGPISRYLKHFNSITSKLFTEIGESISVHMIYLLLSNENDIDKVNRDTTTWNQILIHTPFKQFKSSTLPGLLVQTLLEQTILGKEVDLSAFDSVFADPMAEAKNTLKFVSKMFILVEALGEAKLINSDVATLFDYSKDLVDATLRKL